MLKLAVALRLVSAPSPKTRPGFACVPGSAESGPLLGKARVAEPEAVKESEADAYVRLTSVAEKVAPAKVMVMLAEALRLVSAPSLKTRPGLAWVPRVKLRSGPSGKSRVAEPEAVKDPRPMRK